MFGEAPLPAQLIQRLLGEVWLLDADAVKYAAIGYGSYHWRATMSGDVRWLVTADTDTESAPVATAYELAYRLAADGVVFVRTHSASSWWGHLGG